MNRMLVSVCCSLLLGGLLVMTAADTITLDGQKLSLRTIYADRFDKLAECWVVDGKPDIKIADGKLRIDATGEGHARYATIWLKKELSGDVLIDYEAFCPPQETTAANLNQFLMAHEKDGADVLSVQHSGNYGEYHSLPLYIITLTEKWSRLRKCPGFLCVSERLDVHSVNEKKYRLQILKTGDRIRFFINGQKAHDWTDEEGSYTSGRFGLRTWNTVVEYDNLTVYGVGEAAK